jgi:transcriptional regulator with XRE-family HTH domain
VTVDEWTARVLPARLLLMVDENRDGLADRQTLGQRIRELRLRRGWSQQLLGEKVGVRQKQISSYERNVNIPSGQIFIALADAFDVSLDYLARRGGSTTTHVTVADRELIEKVQVIDRLADEDRALVKRVIDLVLLKHQFRELVS